MVNLKNIGEKMKRYGSKVEKKSIRALDKSVDRIKESLVKKTPIKKPKQILKKQQASVTIKDYKAPSVLGDINRFFRGELNEAKRSMFFDG